jgi:MFS family permease
MAAEEMPAGSRAYSVSILAVSGALGAGVALAAFPIADVDKRGWRALFAIAILGVPLVLRFGRALPESRRFRAPHRDVGLAGHGKRFWLLAASAFLFAIFWGPAAQYQNVFLRRERGFSAARISLFTVGTNIWGGIGIVAGGRLADVRGRRIVAAVGIIGGVGCTVVMFFASGWSVWAWSTVASIIGAATVPALGVYGPELFPTSLRGRANGVISGVGRIGSVLGLLVIAIVIGHERHLAPVMAVLAVGPALVVVLVLTAYPETAHRELEELNPEDQPAGR